MVWTGESNAALTNFSVQHKIVLRLSLDCEQGCLLVLLTR